MGRLQDALHLSLDAARTLKGTYNKALTLYNLPASFMVPLTASVIPHVSAALQVKRRRQAAQISETTLRTTALLSIPAGVGLSVLAGPILLLLYPARQETALAATYHLQLLGIASVFVCIMLLTNSIMQAHGKVNWPIITMLIGGAVKVGINYVLVGDPEINIKGAPIGTLICYGLIALINLALVSRLLEKKPNYPAIFAKPVIASAIMGAAAWASHGLLGKVLYGGYMKSSLCTMLSMGIAVVVYLILVITLGMITREDLRMVPHGAKLAKILHL